MKILITGGAGYLGSALVGTLLRDEHEVLVLDSLLHGGQAIIPSYIEDNFKFVRGDIRSPEIVRSAMQGCDAVVHLAAIVGDPACAANPDLASEINLAGTLQVFAIAQEQAVKRFIFASTCSNYGQMSESDDLVNEESELHPLSVYAETKVNSERSLLDLSSRDAVGVTILRFATLFGLSPRVRFDLTVNEFTAELMSKRELTVYGEQFWRPYVHVRDAARAISLVLSSPSDTVEGIIFNVGDTDQNYTKGDLVKEICDQIGGDLNINRIRKEEDPRDYRVTFKKIREHLDFQITRTVKDGIGEIIDAIDQGVISDLDNPRYRN